jgi:hypothetical protein
MIILRNFQFPVISRASSVHRAWLIRYVIGEISKISKTLSLIGCGIASTSVLLHTRSSVHVLTIIWKMVSEGVASSDKQYFCSVIKVRVLQVLVIDK